jgi:hypothetical protein
VDTVNFSTSTPYSSSAADPGAGIMFDPTAVLQTPQVSIDSVLTSIPDDQLPGLQNLMNTYVSPWANDSSTTTQHGQLPSLTMGQWIAIGGVVFLLVMLIAKK